MSYAAGSLTLSCLVLLLLGGASQASEARGATGRDVVGASVKRATAAKGRVRFELRGKRLTIGLSRGLSRSANYAFHHARVRYACYTDVWASLGQGAPGTHGVARGLTTQHFPRGVTRKTIRLDRDISSTAGACIVESLRPSYRFDAATGLFISPPEFVRTGAPGPPDLMPRPDERKLDVVNGAGVSLFLGPRLCGSC